MKKLALAFLLLSAGLALGQADVIVPGDNLVTEGLPPIPANLAAKVNRYTEFRAAALADWHPKRREMLVSTRFGETAQVHLVKTPGGARRQLTFFADHVMGAAFQPGQGDFFVFSKGTGGNERYQLYRYDLASGDVTLLTDGKSRNSGGAWSHKGDRNQTDGWWLAADDQPGNRSHTAASGMRANECLAGGKGGLPSLSENIKKLNPQLALYMLGTNDINGGRKLISR